MKEDFKEVDEVDRVKLLSKKLESSTQVRRYDSNSETGGWRVAYSLEEIEMSFKKIFPDLLNKLKQVENPEQVDEVLLEIGEEFRHIVYHIKDSQYFDYVLTS